MASYVAQSGNKLVEIGVYTRTTDELDPGFWLAAVCHALADLLIRLADELHEESTAGFRSETAYLLS